MAGSVEGWDERSRLRVSDADRHQVAEFLRQSAGEGRLDIEELEQRLEATYAAKTYGELVPLTADLPSGQTSQPLITPAQSGAIATRYDSSIAVMSTTNRTGAWEIGPTHAAYAIMGGVKLDLRQALFTSRETVISAYGVWGGIDIYVNAQTRVVVNGVAIMGTFDQTRDRIEPDIGPESQVVRVSGLALMAGVSVHRRPMPGQGRGRRLPR
jgi:hypothetical protein